MSSFGSRVYDSVAKGGAEVVLVLPVCGRSTERAFCEVVSHFRCDIGAVGVVFWSDYALVIVCYIIMLIPTHACA